MQHLENYGWNPWFAHQLAALEDEARHDTVARVVQEHKEAYLVQTAAGKLWAEISGKMRHHAAVRADFPAVGDWVLLRGMELALRQASTAPSAATGPVVITAILPRRTVLARRLEARGGDEHILATNVDYAFLGTSLNENFNLRRLERYLHMTCDAGVQPVILLTKADLCPDPRPYVEEIRVAAQGTKSGGGTPIHIISVVTKQGLDELLPYLRPGTTAVILGSSGIGESTLVNHLAEADLQDMMDTRDFDDKGRHCTTFRHLVRTPTGGLIIDTPGLRGLTLGEAHDALMSTFADVETLAAACKFSNCAHATEPGCAIKSALESGALDPARLESYLKLQRETAALAARDTRIAERKQKKLGKRSAAQLHKKTQRKWGH